MNSSTNDFEQKGAEIAKRVFSGQPVSPEELDLHNVYWQFVQVNNRGLEQWLRDCEAEEPMNTVNSLKHLELDEVAELTLKAMGLLTRKHLSRADCDTDTANSEAEDSIGEIVELDRQYLEYRGAIFAIC
ncbi:MAG: hypothetical protein GY712_10530 [Oceanicoccus sp.]|uniref:DMP19 family protein n=1 Tax=Oceanicoccus sp. TaxID=2691044 RepID=UPI002630CD1E|nr:DUF4375 domain-containing protein [Oceanicoccus sp.]MCP3908437.1 hypothetical protein [Oceanicoccus sp.]